MIAPTDIRRTSYPCIAARQHAHLHPIRRSLFTIRYSRCCGFTLLELLAVTTIMALAVGLVTLKLDGLTSSGRVRSVAAQVASYVRVAQFEARLSGQSQTVELDTAAGELRIWKTAVQGAPAASCQSFHLASRVEITDIWFEDDRQKVEQGKLTFRIDGHGRYRRCALLFRVQENLAVCVLPCVRPPFVMTTWENPRAESLTDLLMELTTDGTS